MELESLSRKLKLQLSASWRHQTVDVTLDVTVDVSSCSLSCTAQEAD